MKNAIIIHGMPSKEEYFDPANPAPSHNHWFPWLQRQLQLQNILAQTPEMPKPYNAKYSDWCEVIEQFKITEDTILIGHSLGGGFLVRWLSEHKKPVGRVVLVAPWLDPNKELTTGFFDFEIDRDMVKRAKDVTVFISDDDDQEELTTVEILKQKVRGIAIREFIGKGHFILQHMKTEEFPELRDFLLQ